MTAKTSKKSPSKATKQASQAGKLVRVMTPEERIADIRAYGEEQARSKASALDFLHRAGIITKSGKLAKPFSAA